MYIIIAINIIINWWRHK